MGTDDEGPHIAHIDVSAGNGESCEMERLAVSLATVLRTSRVVLTEIRGLLDLA